MKKLILTISIAFWAALPANAQSRIVVRTPAKRITVHTRRVNAKPVARIVVVKPAPIVVVKPALRRRVIVVRQ
ncbi:hypothetical protein [Pedobacter sp. Leaf176]|uniref:hypothetical protein n=1 Tax=Pedobacter sp. Leaf176 TaxID=1736286 RepID=UPI0006F7826A|nr:hypothetical protein [Pedobacter sp. Leaf176]KQR66953.1 hypothetical protein ASF92_19575 [Pedobacter sp. Leaf176]